MPEFLSSKKGNKKEGRIILKFDSICQNTQSDELNDPSTSFIFSIFDGTIAESGNDDHLSLLNELTSLRKKSLTDVGRIHVHLLLRFISFNFLTIKCICDNIK